MNTKLFFPIFALVILVVSGCGNSNENTSENGVSGNGISNNNSLHQQLQRTPWCLEAYGLDRRSFFDYSPPRRLEFFSSGQVRTGGSHTHTGRRGFQSRRSSVALNGPRWELNNDRLIIRKTSGKILVGKVSFQSPRPNLMRIEWSGSNVGSFYLSCE